MPGSLSISQERDVLDHVGVVLALVPAMFLFGFNATFVDTPRILVVSELSSDRYRIQWVSGATLLGGVIGMAMIVWLIEHLGTRMCFQIGLLIYAASSLGGSLANSIDVLVLTRFFQNWGNGMAITTVLILLWREFPQHRDLGLALFAFGVYSGRILGPTFTAWLVNHDDWRSVFRFTAAVAGVLFLISWWALAPNEPPQQHHGHFDFIGLGLLVGWVVCLAIGLFRFQLWGWQHANETLVVAALGLLFFLGFLWRQFAAQNPLLELRMFGRHYFAMSVIIKALFDGQFFTVIAILIRYMVITRDYPRPTASAVFLPGVAAMVATLAFSACFGNRNNRKLRLIIGLFGMTVATWQLTRVDLFTEKEWVSIVFAVWAGAAGLVASPVITIAEHNLQPHEIVRSLSIKNFALLLPGLLFGGIIRIATERAGDAYFDVLRQTIQPNRTPVDDVSAGLADWIASTHGSEPGAAVVQASQVLGRYIRDTASVYADQTAFGWLTVTGAVAFILSLFIRKLPPDAPGPKWG